MSATIITHQALDGPTTRRDSSPLALSSDHIKLISYLAGGLVSILAALAFILSYSSLRHLAATNGVGQWLSYLWPLLLDFAMVVYSLAILRANLRQEPALYPWLLTVVFASMATVANVLDVATLGIPPVVVAAAVKALAPVALVLAFELLMQMVKAELRRAGVVSSLAELSAIADTRRADLVNLAADLDKLNGQIEAAAVKLESLKMDIKAAKSVSVQELAAARQAKIDQRRAIVLEMVQGGLTESDIAGELDVSLKTIRRDIVALNGQVAAAQGVTS